MPSPPPSFFFFAAAQAAFSPLQQLRKWLESSICAQLSVCNLLSPEESVVYSCRNSTAPANHLEVAGDNMGPDVT